MKPGKINRSLAARLELRRALADLVRRFPRLTTPEAQERAREFLELHDDQADNGEHEGEAKR